MTGVATPSSARPARPTPVMHGTLFRNAEGKHCVGGSWAMSQDDYDRGVTSKFEYALAEASPAQPHLPGGRLPEAGATAGADTGASAARCGSYVGWFEIRAAAHSAQVVRHDEKGISLEFSNTPAADGSLEVSGHGQNKFGAFKLDGTVSPAGSVKLFKSYAPRGQQNKSSKRRSSRTPRSGGGSNRTASRTPRSTGLGGGTPGGQATPGGSGVARSRSARRRSTPSHLRDSDADPLAGAPELLRHCETLLTHLMNHQQAGPFLEPVDPVRLNIPDYYDVITDPMDLGTVRERLLTGRYRTHNDFARDVRLVWRNALTYNKPGTPVHIMAEAMSNHFEKKFTEMIMKHQQKEARAAERAKKRATTQPGVAGFALTGWPSPGGGGGGGGGSGKRGGGSGRKRSRNSGGGGGGGAAVNAMPGYPQAGYGGSDIAAAGGTEAMQLFVSMQQQMQQMQSLLASMAQGGIPPAVAPPTSVPQAQPRVQHVPELTYDQKRQLSTDIDRLDGDKLERVVQIIQESDAAMSTDTGGELEVDIDSLDNATLRRLWDYVQSCTKKSRKSGSKAKPAPAPPASVPPPAPAPAPTSVPPAVPAAAQPAPAQAADPLKPAFPDSDSDDAEPLADDDLGAAASDYFF